MESLKYKTLTAKKENIKKEWLIVDAENQVLGRLATKVARLIRGKLKTNFSPNVDCGDNVIVINAEKVMLTGKKLTDKTYVRYTGYPGGQRFTTPKQLFAKNPIAVVEKAVKGMLPKNKLGSKLFKNLYVYAGQEHPHTAQQAKTVNLNSIK